MGEMGECQRNKATIEEVESESHVITHVECVECTRVSNFTYLYYTGPYNPENNTKHNVLNNLLRIGQSLRMGHAI